MHNDAKYTNGCWELPAHARGVAPPPDMTRVPPGERGLVAGYVAADGTAITLKDPARPENGWTAK